MHKNKNLKNKYKHVDISADQSTDEIITKPNQSMSIRDILFRNTSGMSYDNYKTSYYEEQATFSSESVNKIQDMEPVEKLQYIETLNHKMHDLKTKIEADEAAKQAAIQEAQAQQTKNDTKTEE